MALLLIQPLMIGGYLPGVPPHRRRLIHRSVGGVLVAAVLVHVGALWLTSAPDVIDALLFRSPTPFSDWGVIAMWTTFAVAVIAAFRKRLKLRPRVWRLAHTALAAVTVVCSAVHAIQIEGTMETFSKYALCAAAIAATVKVCTDLRVWSVR